MVIYFFPNSCQWEMIGKRQKDSRQKNVHNLKYNKLFQLNNFNQKIFYSTSFVFRRRNMYEFPITDKKYQRKTLIVRPLYASNFTKIISKFSPNLFSWFYNIYVSLKFLENYFRIFPNFSKIPPDFFHNFLTLIFFF